MCLKKNVFSVIVMIVLTMSLSITSLAKEDDKNLKTYGFNIEYVDKEELPKGAEEYDSLQEALDTFKGIVDSLEYKEPEDNEIMPYSTSRDVLVKSYSNGVAKVNLRCAYTTTGNANTGKVSSKKAYTTYTGLTISTSWKQSYASATLASSGKDILCKAGGVLNYNVIVEGIGTVISDSVTLSGTVNAIR